MLKKKLLKFSTSLAGMFSKFISFGEFLVAGRYTTSSSLLFKMCFILFLIKQWKTFVLKKTFNLKFLYFLQLVPNVFTTFSVFAEYSIPTYKPKNEELLDLRLKSLIGMENNLLFYFYFIVQEFVDFTFLQNQIETLSSFPILKEPLCRNMLFHTQ